MPRIGRFLKCQGVAGCVTDTCTNTDDRRNWMPVEVLQDNIYSLASDVYMLAMAVYEFYATASLSKTTPIVNRLEAVPFATLDRGKLLDSLFREEIPNQPTACPDWMYRLLKPCWNRDPTRRPSAKSLLTDIESVISTMSDDISDLSCANSSYGSDSARSTYATISSLRRRLPPRPPLQSQQQQQQQAHHSLNHKTPEDTDAYIEAVYNDSNASDDESSTPESHNGHSYLNTPLMMQEQSKDSIYDDSCCSEEASLALGDGESNVINECGTSTTDSNRDQTTVSSSSENSHAVSCMYTEGIQSTLKVDTFVPNPPVDGHDDREGSSYIENSNTTAHKEDATQNHLHHGQHIDETGSNEVWV